MSPTPESLQERYAAIETIYGQQDWPAVQTACEALLADLPDDTDDPLRQRLQLLLGHTQLYGQGDPLAAADHYGAVLASNPEAMLREIAEQGLQQCAQTAPTPTPTPTTDPEPEEPEEPDGGTMAAMPWLQDLGGPAAARVQRPVASAVVTPRIDSPAEPLGRALQEPAMAATPADQPIREPLSPEELEELSSGLLKVVIS